MGAQVHEATASGRERNIAVEDNYAAVSIFHPNQLSSTFIDILHKALSLSTHPYFDNVVGGKLQFYYRYALVACLRSHIQLILEQYCFPVIFL